MAVCVREIFGAAILCTVFATIYCIDSVPVVVWQSQSQKTDLPSVSAVEHFSKKEFETDLRSHLNKDGPVLFFLLDHLSLEDFTLFGNVYGTKNNKNAFENVQNFLEHNPSMMFPSVQSPDSSVSTLSQGRNLVDLNPSETDFKDLKNSFAVVKLPSTAAEGEKREETLTNNDKLIGDIVAKVAAQFPVYTAILTAIRPSWDEGEPLVRRVRRHVLDDGTGSGNYTLFMRDDVTNETCFMFYTDHLSVGFNSSSSAELTLQMTDLDIDFESSGNCNNVTDLEVTIIQTSVIPGASPLKLWLSFGHTSYDNDWILNAVNVTRGNGDVYGISLKRDIIWAPTTFSYHCTPMNFSLSMGNDKGWLYLPNFQIQAFNFTKTSDGYPFGDFFDCVGFFTIAIWMTIFFCGILVVILGFGINAIMSINTMDRFDDPKGKTITVTAME